MHVCIYDMKGKSKVCIGRGGLMGGGGLREDMRSEREYAQSTLCENVLMILMLLCALKFATSSYPFTHTFINQEGLIISIALPLST